MRVLIILLAAGLLPHGNCYGQNNPEIKLGIYAAYRHCGPVFYSGYKRYSSYDRIPAFGGFAEFPINRFWSINAGLGYGMYRVSYHDGVIAYPHERAVQQLHFLEQTVVASVRFDIFRAYAGAAVLSLVHARRIMDGERLRESSLRRLNIAGHGGLEARASGRVGIFIEGTLAPYRLNKRMEMDGIGPGELNFYRMTVGVRVALKHFAYFPSYGGHANEDIH